MNLNFIQDNDKIHVESQNQIAYKEEIILKIKLLNQDFQDYSEINPSLNNINTLFSQIVNDLYQHVTNFKLKASESSNVNEPFPNEQNQPIKKKKKMSIPYGTVRKLQTLKQKFITCKKTIENQNQHYRQLNINRQNHKKSDVKFYKSVLHSYQTQRQYFKKQTLNLEDHVQEVQAVVKSLSYNDNHQFTDFDSKVITYESIFKYEKKMNAFGKVLDEIKLIEKAKHQINKVFKNDPQTENLSDQPKHEHSLVYGKNFVKAAQDMLMKVNLLKKQKTQILQHQLLKLINKVAQEQLINQKLKKAILQNESQKYFMDMETKIKKYKGNLKQKKGAKMTKTDFMLYLKELDGRIKDYFKSKEIVYRFKKPFTDAKQQTRSRSLNLSRP